ncbi:hypothetical protein R3P38DRAFT_467758 [Favolaschia claudopus]|uniref:Secreted protein n=1 Tax=Favolaschia claudopus TaxID=2862362 RepID=A0AAV9ZG30_9AGAR
MSLAFPSQVWLHIFLVLLDGPQRLTESRSLSVELLPPSSFISSFDQFYASDLKVLLSSFSLPIQVTETNS